MAVTNKSKTQVNAMKYPLRTDPITTADVPCGTYHQCREKELKRV